MQNTSQQPAPPPAITLYESLVLDRPTQNLTSPDPNPQLRDFIHKVINFQDNGQRLINKFTLDFLLDYFDRYKIEQLQKLFGDNSRKMDIVQFNRFFLNAIEHKESETLYLSMALVDIFKELTMANDEQQVSFLDLTNYICEKIVENDSRFKLQLKLLPPEKRIQASSLSSVRQIDKNAPLIHEKAELSLPKIVKGKIKTDKTSHTSGPISEIIFSKQLNRLLTLDTLSSSIRMFDTNLNFKKELTPSQSSKNTKDVALLSFAYSKKQQRIGCIVKDFGMSFWQAADGFTTQKHISRASGEKIYYFELFEEWVTTEGCRTHFWDIRQQKIKSTIQGAHEAVINSICEIPILRVVCIAYSGKEHNKHLSLYRGKQQLCRLPLGHPGCHTVHFNKVAQVLIPIGYRITIPVYSIHPEYLDFTLITQLQGHSSLVTCVADVEETTIICTGDDTGYIRLWDLRTMQCVQVVKPARNINHLLYLDSTKLVFTDSRVNMMFFDSSTYEKTPISSPAILSPSDPMTNSPGYQAYETGNGLYPIGVYFHRDTSTFVCATREDVRIYSAVTGRLLDLYKIVVSSQEEISAFILSSGRRFMLGTDQGLVKKYSQTGELLSTIHAHNNEVSNLFIDNNNNLLLTTGWDSDVSIWEIPGNTPPNDTAGMHSDKKSMKRVHTRTVSKDDFQKRVKPIRSMRSGHFHKQISIVETNLYHNLIATGSRDCNVYLWDYEYAKLAAQIKFPVSPTALCMIPMYPLLVVGTADSKLYFIMLERKQLKFKAQVLLVRECSESVGRIVANYEYTADESDFRSCCLLLCMNNGKVESVDIFGLLKNGQLQQTDNAAQRKNYNATRCLSEDFQNEFNKNQFTKLDIMASIYNVPCESQAIQTKSRIRRNNSSTATPDVSSQRANTACSQSILKTLWLKDIHRDAIHNASLFQNSEKLLLTSSIDGSIRITRLTDGYILCIHNINVIQIYLIELYNTVTLSQHPLPLKWDMKIDLYSQVKQKTLLSLKIIHSIFKKYETTITVNESKYLSLKTFLDRLSQTSSPQDNGQFITLPAKLSKPIVLSDEYSPSDMNPKYPRSSQSTLKEMEAYKRVYLSNNNKPLDITNNPNKLYHSTNKAANPALPGSASASLFQTSPYDPRNQDRDSVAQLLDPHYFAKLMNKGIPSKTDYLSIDKQKKQNNPDKKQKLEKQKPKKKFNFLPTPTQITQPLNNNVSISICQQEKSDILADVSASYIGNITGCSQPKNKYRQDFIEYARQKNYLVQTAKRNLYGGGRNYSHISSHQNILPQTAPNSNTSLSSSSNYQLRKYPSAASSLITLLNSKLDESKHCSRSRHTQNSSLPKVDAIGIFQQSQDTSVLQLSVIQAINNSRL